MPARSRLVGDVHCSFKPGASRGQPVRSPELVRDALRQDGDAICSLRVRVNGVSILIRISLVELQMRRMPGGSDRGCK